MIRAAILASIITLSVAGPADANPIVVRSGDHDGFTRLVMRLPGGTTWQLTEAVGQKTITVSDHEAGFDISRVFNVIPRDQLVEVRQYASRLELDLSCACELNTFVERGDFLVVDIIDGPPLPPQDDAQSARFIPARPASSFNFGDLLWSEFSTAEDARELQDQVRNLDETDARPTSSAQVRAEEDLIEQTREQLMRGLGNATSRGILEPATPDLQAVIGVEPAPPSQDIFDSSKEAVSLVTPETGNIRITNSRDAPTTAVDTDLMTSGAVCAAPDRILVSTWGGSNAFHHDVAKLRRNLFSEVDRLNNDTAIKLARLYIYYGFGAEAKQVLRLSDDLLSNNPELMDLSDIMEHGFARNPRFVHRFADCDSELALWAAMAAQELPSDQLINEKAALRALGGLPEHLQSFIAPALSRRLADRGSLEAASIALRNVEWSEVDQGADADLAKAKIEKKSGNVDGAEAILSDVMQENAEETPEALVAYVDSRLTKGEPVPADVALLIETYAFEHRDSSLGTDLQRAHVIASAYSGQFPKAFEAMRSDLVSNDPNLIAELKSHTFSALASRADDITFLDTFFTQFPSPPSTLSPASLHETLKRLLDLGFTAETEAVLAAMPADKKSNLLRVLHADALLALGQADTAMTVLDDVEGNEADTLRAGALSQMGQNEEAHRLFDALDSADEAVRSAWLADDWSELLPTDAPVLGDARALAEEVISDIEARNGMLEAVDTAVEKSMSARSTLEDLLQGTAIGE